MFSFITWFNSGSDLGEKAYVWAMFQAERHFNQRFTKLARTDIDVLLRFEAIAMYMALAAWALRRAGVTGRKLNKALKLMQSRFNTDFLVQVIEMDEQAATKVLKTLANRINSYNEGLSRQNINLLVETILRNNVCDKDNEAKLAAIQMLALAQHLAVIGGLSWLDEIKQHPNYITLQHGERRTELR